MTNEREQALRSVLGDKLELVAEMGFAVVDADELDRYQKDRALEVERARRIAKAALDASGSRGLLVDILFGGDGCLRVVVCDPQGDEEAMAGRVVAAIGVATGPLKKIGEPPRRVCEPEAVR